MSSHFAEWKRTLWKPTIYFFNAYLHDEVFWTYYLEGIFYVHFQLNRITRKLVSYDSPTLHFSSIRGYLACIPLDTCNGKKKCDWRAGCTLQKLTAPDTFTLEKQANPNNPLNWRKWEIMKGPNCSAVFFFFSSFTKRRLCKCHKMLDIFIKSHWSAEHWLRLTFHIVFSLCVKLQRFEPALAPCTAREAVVVGMVGVGVGGWGGGAGGGRCPLLRDLHKKRWRHKIRFGSWKRGFRGCGLT